MYLVDMCTDGVYRFKYLIHIPRSLSLTLRLGEAKDRVSLDI